MEIELHCGDLWTWLPHAPCGMVKRYWRLQTVVVVPDEEEGLQVWEDYGVCGWQGRLELGELETSRKEETEVPRRTTAHDWDPHAGIGGIA